MSLSEEEQIRRDFKKARRIFNRIVNKELPEVSRIMNPHILFALCLIYARQLNHHKKEESG